MIFSSVEGFTYKLFSSTRSHSLSFSEVLKRCEHRMWSAESVSGKWEMVKTTENSSVCLKFDSCLTCLLQRADWRTRWYMSEKLRLSSLYNKKYCWFPSECLRSYCKICPTLAAPLRVWALSRSRLSSVSMVRDRLISRKFRNEESWKSHEVSQSLRNSDTLAKMKMFREIV